MATLTQWGFPAACLTTTSSSKRTESRHSRPAVYTDTVTEIGAVHFRAQMLQPLNLCQERRVCIAPGHLQLQVQQDWLPARNGMRNTRSKTVASAAPPAGAQRMKTWSNPAGQPLREVIPGKVWAAERPFIWYGIDVGGRMTAVKLADGSLWVHSPIPLDPELKAEIDQLGPLRYVVSPNYEHCSYAKEWIDAYPDATSYACPGLMEKRPDIKYSTSVGTTDEPPAEWKDEFELAWLDCERNPFDQKPFFNEVVFHHKPSKTLFVSDLFWNYPEQNTSLATWLWKQGMDRVYLPFYKKFMLYRRDRFQEQVERIMRWEWDTIVPCHGYLVTSRAKETLSSFLC